MVKSRSDIALDRAQLIAYLQSMRTMTCATNGPRGLPHLAPLWFTVTTADEDEIRLSAWTYGKSQKVVNLRTDPRAVLQLEDGSSYRRLRGAVLECDVTVVADEGPVREAGLAIACRYGSEDLAVPIPVDGLSAGAREDVERQVAKRVALGFSVRHHYSWDHRRLGSAPSSTP